MRDEGMTSVVDFKVYNEDGYNGYWVYLWTFQAFFLQQHLNSRCLQKERGGAFEVQGWWVHKTSDIYIPNMTTRKCQDYVYIKWEYWSTMKKIKHSMRHDSKVNENNGIILQGIKLRNKSKTTKKLFSFMSNLQTYYHFELDFRKGTNIQEASG